MLCKSLFRFNNYLNINFKGFRVTLSLINDKEQHMHLLFHTNSPYLQNMWNITPVCTFYQNFSLHTRLVFVDACMAYFYVGM